MDKTKNFIIVLLSAALLFGLAFWAFLKPADAASDSERRPLASAPELSAKSLLSGKYMQSFEKYATDQFPMRDFFRSIKAFTAFELFRNKDVNDIYRGPEGYLSKLEYPLDESSIQNAADKFARIREKYLSDTDAKVYFSVIPDKNYFMARDAGMLCLDYDKFVAELTDRCRDMTYINIFDLLELEDYYKTDTHWRQEKIVDVAARLLREMGALDMDDLAGAVLGPEDLYQVNTLDAPFYGVYCGQAALNSQPETLYYLTSAALEDCTVYDGETDKTIGVYDMEKAHGKDAYEIFLSGSKSILKITNPAAENDRKLIVFRDSFGSSLTPLLVQGYREIDVVDIRYLSSEMLAPFLEFDDCDVLFIYSTLVLNNSITLK